MGDSDAYHLTLVFFIQSEGGFSLLHTLSVISITSVTIALWGIRNDKYRIHRGFMIGAWAGLVIAGFFAVILPDRFLYHFLFVL